MDIHSIEVLKGPQGMLFGKNASAGLINIVSNSPELGKTDTTLRAAYGSYDLQQYTRTVNLALGDTSAVPLSGWQYKHKV